MSRFDTVLHRLLPRFEDQSPRAPNCGAVCHTDCPLQVSLIGEEEGYLAVFQFRQLERLKTSNPELANKMNVQLATAALSKRYEQKGGQRMFPLLVYPP